MIGAAPGTSSQDLVGRLLEPGSVADKDGSATEKKKKKKGGGARPLKMEICSGTGEWAVAQVSFFSLITLELRGGLGCRAHRLLCHLNLGAGAPHTPPQ